MKRKINVLYVHNNLLNLAQVVVSKTPYIEKSFSVKFVSSNIREAIHLLATKFNLLKVHLLLGSEYTYVVKFTIPVHIQLSEERSYVYKRMSELVPEVVTDEDWDFKVVSQTKEEKTVLVFALVQNSFKPVRESLMNSNIEVEAIEPDEISQIRNSNPIIGIAIKDDMYGNDEKSLNINLENLKDTKHNYSVFIYLNLVICTATLIFLLDMIFRGWLY